MKISRALVAFMLWTSSALASPLVWKEVAFNKGLSEKECTVEAFFKGDQILWSCGLRPVISHEGLLTQPYDASFYTPYSLSPFSFAASDLTFVSYGTYKRTIRRCDPDCVDITPTDAVCNDVTSEFSVSLITNSHGDTIYSCFSTEEPPASRNVYNYVIPLEAPLGSAVTYISKFDSKSDSTDGLNVLFNNKQNFAYEFYAGSYHGKFWDGKSLKTLPRSANDNFTPLLLLEDGSLIGYTKDISYTPHLLKIQNGKVTKVTIADAIVRKKIYGGTFFEAISKAADNTAIVQLKGLRTGNPILQITNNTARLVKLPAIAKKIYDITGSECGSVLFIKRAVNSSGFVDANARTFILEKEGCND